MKRPAMPRVPLFAFSSPWSSNRITNFLNGNTSLKSCCRLLSVTIRDESDSNQTTPRFLHQRTNSIQNCLRKGDTFDVQIESLAYGGAGISHLPSEFTVTPGEDAALVFTPKGVVPGDTVRVVATKIRRHTKWADSASPRKTMNALDKISQGQSYVEASIVDRIARSAHAVVPPCQHFGNDRLGGGGCGGCVHMDMDYRFQLDLKQRQVEDIFADLGTHCPDVGDIVPCNKIFGYRNKMEFSYGRKWFVDGPRKKKSTMAAAASRAGNRFEVELPEVTSSRRLDSGLEYALGLHASGRYDRVVHVSDCHVQIAEGNSILQFMRERCHQLGFLPYDSVDHSGYLRNVAIRSAVNGSGEIEIMVNIMTNPCHVPKLLVPMAVELRQKFPRVICVVQNMPSALANSSMEYSMQRLLAGDRDYIEQHLCGLDFQISANSFFQTNAFQAEILYNKAKKAAKLQPSDTLLDLFCGTGTIGLSMASSCKKVIGVEVVEDSLTDARRNAARNGVENVEFLHGDLTRLREMSDNVLEKFEADVVIVDPPRAGLHKNLIRYLSRAMVRRIVYISCNPATQAQDIKRLFELAPNRFYIDEVTPVDMFPHTPHIETVCSIGVQNCTTSDKGNE